MKALQPNNSKAWLFSFLLHGIVLVLLMLSFNFSSPMPVVQNADKNVINAMVLSAPPSPPAKKIYPKPVPPPKPVLAAAPPPKVIPKKIEEIPVKKAAIVIPDKKLKVQKKPQPDKIAEQMLADLKKQKELNKQAKQKALAKAFQKEIKELAAKSLQSQMQQEEKRLSSQRAAAARGEVNKYKALILQAISQNWLVPGGANKKAYAELMIRLAPGGTVLDVQLVKSSGDEALDRSARAAVFKSSPLPVPSNADAFDEFRQFVLKVKPENVLGADSWMS